MEKSTIIEELNAWSAPEVAEVLVEGKRLDRAALAALISEGGRDRIRFEARVFRNVYPNLNFYRFRDEDMGGFAASFVGQPFLRNHDTHNIESRDGTIHASRFEGDAIVQEVDLTTERGMKSFLEGQIDRFSVGWFFEGLTCSVCENDWRNVDMCPHWPGQGYKDDEGNEQMCELIFEGPTGKETSAVNVPAVGGTGLLAALAEARAAGIGKEAYLMDPKDELQEEEVEETVAVAATASTIETAVPETGWEAVLRKQGTDALLNASGLSRQAKEAIRAGLDDEATPDDVTDSIERMRGVLAAERDSNVVQGIDAINAGDMQDGLDRWTRDWEYFLGMPGAPLPSPRVREGGTRGMYTALTGDFGQHGRFYEDQAQLANANSNTLAGVTANVLNRIVEHYYRNEPTYRWFERIVEAVPNDGSTQDVEMVMVDGIPNLPTVAEGAAYTELPLGDSQESLIFNKKGGYIALTLEMIFKNQIGRVQSVPRGLVQASVRTRSAAVGNVFTANSGVGPTLGASFGSKALFHADHNNLATTAFGKAGWAAMRTQIWKQQVPGTGLPLGLWPRYCLVPMDLYDRALTVFNYGSGDVGQPNTAGTAQEPNPYGEDRMMDMRPIPIPVPEFSDLNDWAAIVDPMEHAPIKMSYQNAPGGGMHPMVELFEAESANSGLMFTNDSLPIKARDWWGLGVATYVGVAKRNV